MLRFLSCCIETAENEGVITYVWGKENGNLSNLIPELKGKKLSYSDIELLPEKPTELYSGHFLFTEDEKKALILAYITNFGLEYLIEILPSESLKELKYLLMK